jgi:CRP-like cAMP-binding protein
MNRQFFSRIPLFAGLSPEEIQNVLEQYSTGRQEYQKGQMIYRMGDTVSALGIVISGAVQIEHDDLWGNHSVLDHIGPGQVFAETYAGIEQEPLMVNVVAAQKSEILFLNVRVLIENLETENTVNRRVFRNLFLISAQKNLHLSRRMFHTSSKTIRGRLLAYLSFQAMKQGKSQIVIPLNRQQLADYLNVDRSALSNELSKMQKDGLLTFSKNRFVLDPKHMI